MKGIRFGTIHSYTDLNLILSQVALTPATPKTNYLDIPGRDGVLDLTEANGEVKFHSREFQFTFTVAPGDDLTFDKRVSMVSSALNGLRFQITLDRDPDYYWMGRCAVDKYKQDKNIGKIVVKATVDPYKLKSTFTTLEVELSSTWQSITVENGRMPAIPTFVCSDSGMVTLNNVGLQLKAGVNFSRDLRLVSGTNYIRATGTGTMLIEWQEGEL